MMTLPGQVPGQVIENPLSGERITITGRPRITGDPLAWELVLAPGGRAPSSHSHPEQEERFTVLDGTMRFRIGRRKLLARPGDVVVVPPGTVHHFANAGPVPARVAVQTTPALAMEALLEVAAALARGQQASGRALPRLLDLMLFMHDFEREVRAPYLPAALVRAVTRTLTWVAGRRNLDAGYRRLRPATGAARPRYLWNPPPGGRSRRRTRSKSAISSSATAARPPTRSTVSASTCPTGGSSACSARTAPGKRPRSRSSPRR